MNATQHSIPSIDPIIKAVLEETVDGRNNENIHGVPFMSAIGHNPDGTFDAFMKTSKGTYSLGNFKTKALAEQAIDDATEARWHG